MGPVKLDNLPLSMQQDITRILEGIVRDAVSELKPRPKAIVLGGALGRGEGTVIGDRLVSDIEVIVFTNWKLLQDRRLKAIARRYSSSYPVDICASIPLLLNNASFLSYELKENGTLLYGDRSLLDRALVNSQNIAKWEGFREIFNRLIMIREVEYTSDKATQFYTGIKAYLACAHALLVFSKLYRSTYRERLAKFTKLKEQIENQLFDKIIYSFQVKLNSATSQEVATSKLNLIEAKRDLLSVLDMLLTTYLHHEGSLQDKMQLLDRKFPLKPWFNLYYYLWLQRGKKRPKMRIIWGLKPTTLYCAIVYEELGLEPALKHLLGKFFYCPRGDGELTFLVKGYPYDKLKSDLEILR